MLNTDNTSRSALLSSDQEVLSFVLDGEEYGVDILAVKEIRVWSKVTNIPNAPNYLKGVINLRGTIIPIVDLSERFQRPPKSYNDTTVVIVLHTRIDEKEIVVGIVVDAVSDVYKLDKKDIREAPNFGSNIDQRFITGMATIKDNIVILLNTTKLLDAEHLYNVINQVRAV
ncbi:chemotaxis protein CheW [Paraglaciecola sp. MB-3u-78]|jgi:purine-binding chemotaxis protein CheW|uniref:chemotaxis protein CheW n=1 Tax=Paraglaciecola sp. MB-3u-78 TaxID=2058332 RepID=UPI001E50FBD6|nr:chemotaxis protein CheW [Paraglaciecola sp. MB-3u-78]